MDLEQIFRWPPTRERWQALRRYLQGQRLRVGQGLREVRSPSSGILVSAPRQRPVAGGGGGGCPNWFFTAVEGGVVIGSPGVVGSLTPTFEAIPLTDNPPPTITVPVPSGAYLIYFKMVWDPEATEVYPDQWFMGTGGSLVGVELVVSAEGTPPTDQQPDIDVSTGAVVDQGIEHVVVARVERGEAVDEETDGAVTITDNYLCYSLEWKICNRRLLLGQK
jgi:hypothetical protein